MDALNLGRWMARVEQQIDELATWKKEVTYYGKRLALLALLGGISLLANLDTNKIASVLQLGARLAGKIAGLP